MYFILIESKLFAIYLRLLTSTLPHFKDLLLSHFSCVQTAAHQAPLSLGFSRQEHWNGLPFPSPMHVSEKWKWRHSVVFDSQRPHGLQPTRLLRPWGFPGKSTGVGVPLPSPVKLLSHVQLFATPRTAARQASLSFTIFWSMFKTHVHRVSDAIQPSHPLSPPTPPAFNLSQHQGLF